MAFSIIQPSFAAGELSPSLYARVDLAKYHVGCAMARNFFVDYRGGVSTRPGTEFIAQANPSASGAPIILPFEVDTQAAYALEVGNQYIRFYYLGAQVVEATTPITGITRANPGVVTDAAHGYSNGDEIYLSAIGGMTVLNGKNYLVANVTTNTYTLTDLQGNAINTTTFSAYTSGGTAARIYTLASPWTTADLALLKYAQSADVMTLTHPNYPPKNLTRVTASSFSLSNVVNGPAIDPPTSLSGTVVAGYDTNAYYSYQVTATSADGKEESLPTARVDLGAAVPEDAAHVPTVSLSWDPPAQPVSIYTVYKAATILTAAGILNTVFGYLAQAVSTNYSDIKIQTSTPDFSRTPPQYQDPFSPGQITNVSVSSGGSGYGSNFSIPLTFSGGGGSGAAGYALINYNTGVVVGVVITNYGQGYTSAPTVSDAHGSATYTATIGPTSGTYPSCVSYFQQRRAFAASLSSPETFWLSQTGNYNNYDISAVTQASDGISVSLASRQVNAIKSMVPMSTGLVVLTSGGGFLVSGGSQAAAVTPSSITALPQASTGANDLPPLVINYDILYCQNRGAVVRDLAFDWYKQSYTGTDRSVLASHLFFGHTLTSWCYAEEPYRLVHVVREDGVLLQLTYVPEQEVFAWTHHDTNGLFLSVCSIPEGQENAVYMVMKRYVQGTWRYYIERFASRVWSAVEDTWCVDAALASPRNYPAASITLAAATGNGVEVTATAAVFSNGNVGDTIWAGGGKATVATYIDSTHITVNIIQPFPVVPNDPNSTPIPYAANAWSLDVPITTVSGLDHLDGLTVSGIADGMPVLNLTVANGAVTLPQPATKIVIGLPYQCQFQTLKLDTGDPTIQGKRKTIPAVTWRVNETLGIKTGPDFNTLSEIKYPYTPIPFPPQLVSDDLRKIIQSVWKVDGQICVQQDYPLPATLLGYIPEEVVGDTGR